MALLFILMGAFKMIKLKSSYVLQKALALVESKEQRYACAAIQDVETQERWDAGEDVKSNALKIFQQFKPASVLDSRKNIQEWWPVGDPARIEAMTKAIERAKKQND